MKIPCFFKSDIEECEKENFRRNLIFDNIHRGKILATTIIGFEFILAIIDICSALLKVDNRFHFSGYLIMYSIMICINTFYLLFIIKFEKLNNISTGQLNNAEILIVVYITLIMSWGSVISLMDQKLYGQLIAFMVIMIASSVLYILDNKKILIPYFFSVLIILIFLPSFQSSKDILIGHYVNLCTFIIISWIASRIFFQNYVNDFNNKILLQRSKAMLEKEIEENKDINNKLAVANFQLKNLALIDELTGIPNRRGFRNYIDIAFDSYVNEDSLLSVIIIDIDFFKNFNDNYGHEEGDKALISVAKQIDSVVKNSMEFFCRWGGEEFIYSVFNLAKEDVIILAETIRLKVCELKIPNEFSKVSDNISVSIGTCTIKITGKDDVSKVINLADKALYLAKNSGRNCVKNFSVD